ncbi:MAG: GNAT family N-acetyltransferase [Acidimicrobiales bacterium]|nr:GNAT family N-acetyltransferase [Acidimicrobiales bacterium]
MGDVINLEPLSVDHLDEAVRLSRDAGWPHRRADWLFAFDLGRGFTAVNNGQVVGTMLWWPLSKKHATLGLALVDFKHQRCGIGQQLIEAVLQEAGTRQITLNSTAAGMGLYERNGFQTIGAIHQHQGHPTSLAGRLLKQNAEHIQFPVPVEAILELDQITTGQDRRELLTALHASGETVGIRRGDSIVGYSISRPFGLGRVVGPVAAANSADAKLLIDFWLDKHRLEFLRVDTSLAGGLSPWLHDVGLIQVGMAATMELGSADQLGQSNTSLSAPSNLMALSRLFALSSQALG